MPSSATPTGPVTRTIALRNDVADLTRFNAFLAATAKESGFSEEHVFAIQLCAHEAITNIVNYGFADAGTHDIEVTLQADTHETHLKIVDGGHPFNPTEVPPPPPPDDILDFPIGGQGLALIRNFSTRLEYNYEDGQNRFTIVIAKDAVPAQSI